MGDIVEQQPTGEALQRRGIALLENADSLHIYSPANIMQTDYVTVGELGEINLRGHKSPRTGIDEPGYTLNANGEIIEGKATDFYDRGYFKVSIQGHGRKGSNNLPDTQINLWIGNGPVLSGKFNQFFGEESKAGLKKIFAELPTEQREALGKMFPKKKTDEEEPKEEFALYEAVLLRDNSALYLPPDPELIKKIRVSLESLPTGGETQL